MLLSIFYDAQSIISIITSIIDIFVIVVIAVTVFTSVLPLIKSAAALPLPFLIKSSSSDRQKIEENQLLRRRIVKENFIKGLLLALEFESANAIENRYIYIQPLRNFDYTIIISQYI